MDERPDSVITDLTTLRKRAGITQMGMAAAMGTSQSHVSDLERGVTDPTLGTLARYARVLGVNIQVGLVGHGRADQRDEGAAPGKDGDSAGTREETGPDHLGN